MAHDHSEVQDCRNFSVQDCMHGSISLPAHACLLLVFFQGREISRVLPSGSGRLKGNRSVPVTGRNPPFLKWLLEWNPHGDQRSLKFLQMGCYLKSVNDFAEEDEQVAFVHSSQDAQYDNWMSTRGSKLRIEQGPHLNWFPSEGESNLPNGLGHKWVGL